MTDQTDHPEDRIRKLRHDLANPLSALLAETQLMLMSPDTYDAETLESLQEIEKLSRRMRDILQEV